MKKMIWAIALLVMVGLFSMPAPASADCVWYYWDGTWYLICDGD